MSLSVCEHLYHEGRHVASLWPRTRGQDRPPRPYAAPDADEALIAAYRDGYTAATGLPPPDWTLDEWRNPQRGRNV